MAHGKPGPCKGPTFRYIRAPPRCHTSCCPVSPTEHCKSLWSSGHTTKTLVKSALSQRRRPFSASSCSDFWVTWQEKSINSHMQSSSHQSCRCPPSPKVLIHGPRLMCCIQLYITSAARLIQATTVPWASRPKRGAEQLSGGFLQ